MHSALLDAPWIWHPQWTDHSETSAGAFVHFRKTVVLDEAPREPTRIIITADTRYKLYINQELIAQGPVKGDERMWFYDDIDIQPYLRQGVNHIGVHVLRLYYSTHFSTSLPRLPQAGLLIRSIEPSENCNVHTDSTWETAIDRRTHLPTSLIEDDFLHIYEEITATARQHDLEWIAAKHLTFPQSHGLTMPWQLSPRMIPFPRLEPSYCTAIYNINSTLPHSAWARLLLGKEKTNSGIRLPAGSSHHIELQAEHHTTAMIKFQFTRPDHAGSEVVITYSEAYEDSPDQIPYLRKKGDRLDITKQLLGPQDRYVFGGKTGDTKSYALNYHPDEDREEVFAPFHLRTFRFITLDVHVDSSCDLWFLGIEATAVNYPLDIFAEVNVSGAEESTYHSLWTTSIRTLRNCMHDCYEDCPFYEQLQYVMDTRSSALFTYRLSCDDRLARQAIVQIHNSYNPATGLTCSRTPSQQPQIIPHFSLFWICMVIDHYEHFVDESFSTQFIPVCDGILNYFASRIDASHNLIRALGPSAQWDFVDWTPTWRPMGIPPAGERTGFLSYTNMLYAYVLQQLASMLTHMNHRLHLAAEYQGRAEDIVDALKSYCFDGTFFTDGLAQNASKADDYSQHSQVWAVLCGAAKGDVAINILARSLSTGPDYETGTIESRSSNISSTFRFTPASTAMSFYTLRALSSAGRKLYSTHFPTFWDPWRAQLEQNLDTWCEDSVSLRSDCHAWGCAPIYEFMAEVAGLTPATPGWGVVSFEPKVELFDQAVFKVPLGGRTDGVAGVKWSKLTGNRKQQCECGGKEVILSWQRPDTTAHEIRFQVRGPDGSVGELIGTSSLEYVCCDVACSGGPVVIEASRNDPIKVLSGAIS